ncbi:phage holin, lambda family [Halopseudomonas phragmitis]|uniref:Phage holin, lambda family n=2 Tax=Halopseudomonas phragmitis TaxID=1931241 RepID=A0A1V0B6B2_9GAMM|nr:phage holin, lambda family [Halopseudomonas phragmitis]
MPDRPETWAWLIAWVQQHFPAFYAGALAFFVAFWRIIYTGGRLRQLAIETPLCGLLGVGVHYGAEFIGAPASAGTFFACVVGLLGVETSRAAARRALEKKVEQL